MYRFAVGLSGRPVPTFFITSPINENFLLTISVRSYIITVLVQLIHFIRKEALLWYI